ncbi:MAG: hypothetical protein R3E62_10140 [Pseudomonadales bacterium]|jgi:hypothetical protein
MFADSASKPVKSQTVGNVILSTNAEVDLSNPAARQQEEGFIIINLEGRSLSLRDESENELLAK